jgi:replicative DNA helicase
MNFQNLNKKSNLLEKDLISQMFSNQDKVPVVISRLNEEDLIYYRKHFNFIVDCFNKSNDVIIESQVKNIEFGEVLAYFTGRPIEDVCRDIKNLSNLRQTYASIEKSLKQIDEDNLETSVSELQRNLALANASSGFEAGDIDSAIQEYQDLQKFYKEKFANNQGLIGISTGYEKIDNAIDGFRQGHLWVIGGYTSMGKTFASLNLAVGVIKQKKRVVYYSLEMSKNDIISRLLGIMTEQSGIAIMKGFAKNEESVKSAMDLLKESKVAIHTEKSSLDAIESSMVEENINAPVDLFIIDFLQLVTLKGANSEYEAITTSVVEFQQLSRRLKIPIIILSQVSNESAK